MRLIDLLVSRWQLTLLIFATLSVTGLVALRTIPRAMDPHFPIPIVFIGAAMPGANPTDIEQLIAKPIEDVVRGLDDVKSVRSTSRDGSTLIRIEFNWDTDPDRKYDEVVREVSAIRGNLPAELQRLEFRKAQTTNAAVVQLSLVSATASFRRMDKVARDLRDRLLRVPGIRKSEVWGVPQPEVRVAVDMGRLSQLRIPITAVADALRNRGAELPAGAVQSGDRRLDVRAPGAYRSLEDVNATPVISSGDKVVRIRDIAAVSWQTEEASDVKTHNGTRAVFVTANQTADTNVEDIHDGISAELDAFERQLPPDMTLVRGFDQSHTVSYRLKHLGFDFGLALALVLVTLLPLGWRAALVVIISIPLSLSVGLAVLQALGYTLNQLSIAGFILALGLLVDDTIVVTENIARHIREGQPRMVAAVSATREIAVAILGCTATLILAFLPLIFLPEGAGRFIRSLPVAVTVTVAASMFISLTIIPFLASRMLAEGHAGRENMVLTIVMRGVHRFYRPLLHAALKRPKRAFGIALVICAASFALVPALGLSLFPAADVPYFVIDVDLPEGAALSSTATVMNSIEKTLKSFPEVDHVHGNRGRGNPHVYYNWDPREASTNFAELFVTLAEDDPAKIRKTIASIRRALPSYPGTNINLHEFINGPAVEAPVAFRVTGPRLATLKTIAAQMQARIAGIPGTSNVDNPMRAGRMDLSLGIDEGKAAAIGVSLADVRRVARLALAGEADGTFRDDDGDAYPVVLRLPMGDFQPISALDQVFVPLQDGGSVPLGAISHPGFETNPAQIDRFEGQRAVTVTAQVTDGYLTSDVNTQAEARVRAIPLPNGYAILTGGEADEQSKSVGALLAVIPIVLFVIVGVLVLEFGGFRETAIVLAVIPLGTVGGFTALFLTGNPLSFTAIIGMIALIGIEIKNSILLVDFAGNLRRDGVSLRESIERAGEIRFLPVLLTSVTAMGGLIPLALSGSRLYGPLAWVIIGGLISSTLLSRVMTPVTYLLLARKDAQVHPLPTDQQLDATSA